MGRHYTSNYFYKANIFWSMIKLCEDCVSKDYSFSQSFHFNNSSFLIFNYDVPNYIQCSRKAFPITFFEYFCLIRE